MNRILNSNTVLNAFLFWTSVAFVPNLWAQEEMPSADQAEVKQTVEEVLTNPDYRHLFRKKLEAPEEKDLPPWLEDFLDWLFGRNDSSSSAEMPDVSLSLGTWLFYSALIILVAVLLIMAVNLFRKMSFENNQEEFNLGQDQEAITPTTPPGDIPTNEYEQRALVAARSGDYRSAIRELILGSMSWTERAALIRYRRGLTNRDYVRALWTDQSRRESLLEIIDAFEKVFYGRRPAKKETFQVCLVEFRKSFAQEEDNAHLAN